MKEAGAVKAARAVKAAGAGDRDAHAEVLSAGPDDVGGEGARVARDGAEQELLLARLPRAEGGGRMQDRGDCGEGGCLAKAVRKGGEQNRRTEGAWFSFARSEIATRGAGRARAGGALYIVCPSGFVVARTCELVPYRMAAGRVRVPEVRPCA